MLKFEKKNRKHIIDTYSDWLTKSNIHNENNDRTCYNYQAPIDNNERPQSENERVAKNILACLYGCSFAQRQMK